MEDWNKIISNNISKYRKLSKLTQSELAEKLSFSDKSVSKWERGDAIPDVTVLISMCEIFGITLNDIISEKEVVPKKQGIIGRNRLIISIMSAGLVWLIATFVFVSLLIFAPGLMGKWMCFIYAIPISCIVVLVFSCIWGRWWYKYIIMTLLIWSMLISICLTFLTGIWGLLYIGIPLQILMLLWYLLELNKHKQVFSKLIIKKK